MDPWKVLAGIAALALFYVLLPVAADAFARYRGQRRLRCPETGAEADVSMDAGHAALTAAFGPPDLRVKSCSLWLQRPGCGQSCVRQPEAAQEPAGTRP